MSSKLRIQGVFWERLPKVSMGIGIISSIVAGILYLQDTHHFFFSYLTSYMFFLSISLGALFVVLILHLSRAGWGVVVRRLAEVLMLNTVLMAILFIPILFGLHDLYHWSHADAMAHDLVLQAKSSYLNVPFFCIRAAIYFSIWGVISYFFYKRSVAQDQSGDKGITVASQNLAAPAILLYALTQTFAAVDWMMTLNPHWYSTIFGVYYFAGCALVGIATLSLIALFLRKKGYLKDIITVEHYHDLGKLMYGFMIFWTYIAFSQYFLIWYANIPEETQWFLLRTHTDTSWRWVSLFLVVFHFILPFFLFMSRHIKRNLKFQCLMALWMIIVHFADIYWIIMPIHFREGVTFGLVDIACFLAIGGFFVSVFFKQLMKEPLIPIKDPRVEESKRFENY